MARTDGYTPSPQAGNTYFYTILTGLNPASVGKVYGAHVHVGPCVPGNGPAALGHYNTGTGGDPGPANEVWLDFTVLPGGVGYATTAVPFEIAPGTARSVVRARVRHPARDGHRRRAHRLHPRAVLRKAHRHTPTSFLRFASPRAFPPGDCRVSTTQNSRPAHGV